MAKRKSALAITRSTSTDDVIVRAIAAAGGECDRRLVVRKTNGRSDGIAALARLNRRGVIEIFKALNNNGREVWRVRLIGDTAIQKGAGFVRVGEQT